MAKLKKFGKGIVLMHDFQQATAAAIADLLNDLKAGGYKIVHMRARAPIRRSRPTTKMIRKDSKLPTVAAELADRRASSRPSPGGMTAPDGTRAQSSRLIGSKWTPEPSVSA